MDTGKSKKRLSKLNYLYHQDINTPSKKDDDEPEGIHRDLCNIVTRYERKEKFASGGMKDISKVFDSKTNRYLAIAELHKDSPKEFYESFLREARLTALLDHPNIIPVYDIGVSDNKSPFFTMGLKTGDSLDIILKKLYKKDKDYEERYPLITLLTIFTKVCEAVSYAHSMNVIHLDIKPANIQIGEHGEVYLCDWGLGKIMNSAEIATHKFDEISLNPDTLNNITLTGKIKGTPGYMAPEQTEQKGIKDKQTDIYSIGCLLYAILTHTAPVEGSITKMVSATILGDITPPMIRFPEKNIPDSLNAITMRAIALKPSERYGTIEALLIDTQNYLSGFSTEAENAGIAKEITLFYKRNRPTCLVGAVAIILIATSTAFFIKQLNQKIHETEAAYSLAEVSREEAEAQSEKARKHQTLAEATSLKLRIKEEEKSKLLHKTSDTLSRHASTLYNELFFESTKPKEVLKSAIQIYNQIIKIDDRNKDGAIVKKSICLFIIQAFDSVNNTDIPLRESESRKTVAWSKPEILQLKDLSLKCAKIMGENKALSTDEFIKIISTSKLARTHKNILIEKILTLDYHDKSREGQYHETVKAAIAAWNPEWDSSQFKYDQTSRVLHLSGENLKQLALSNQRNSSRKSLLRFIKIESLHLKGSGISKMPQLHGITIANLDIRGNKITNLKKYNQQYPIFNNLIISKNQFTEEQLKKLPNDVNVIVKDN